MYAKKFGISKEKLNTALWNRYYDPEQKKFSSLSHSDTGKPLEKAFSKFILDPICKIFKSCMEDNYIDLQRYLAVLCIPVNLGVLKNKKLFQEIMSKWLPVNTLLEMVILHLPSPPGPSRFRSTVLIIRQWLKNIDILIFILDQLEMR